MFKSKNDNLILSNALTSIGEYAFGNCSSLASVKIPNSVTSMRSGAFDGCSKLSSITIGNSVTSIESGTFSDCTSLASVTIGNSVSSIAMDAFNGCPNVKELIYAEGTQTIRNAQITSIERVIIPNSAQAIGSYAFFSCSNLTSITIPNSVTSIGEYAFYNCSSLASIAIPNSVTSIEVAVFYGCSSLASITIPNSVTFIDFLAFVDCAKLSSITNLATTPQTISSGTFSNYGTLHVYKSYKSVYEAADVWKNFTIVDDVPPIKATSIALGSSTYYCNIGEVLQPSAIVSDEATIKTVTWTSSDDMILFIADANTGQAIGMQNGVATITATTTDGSALSASAKVYVGDYSAIEDVEVQPNIKDSKAIYNLQGQKIAKLQKGINIVDGKKVLY